MRVRPRQTVSYHSTLREDPRGSFPVGYLPASISRMLTGPHRSCADAPDKADRRRLSQRESVVHWWSTYGDGVYAPYNKVGPGKIRRRSQAAQ
jgi:hypothetical protein